MKLPPRFEPVLLLLIACLSACTSNKKPKESQDQNSSTGTGTSESINYTFEIKAGAANLDKNDIVVYIPEDTARNATSGFVQSTNLTACSELGPTVRSVAVSMSNDSAEDIELNGDFYLTFKNVNLKAVSAQENLVACVLVLDVGLSEVQNQVFYSNQQILIAVEEPMAQVSIPLRYIHSAIFLVDANSGSGGGDSYDQAPVPDPGKIILSELSEESVEVTFEPAITAVDAYHLAFSETTYPDETCNSGNMSNLGTSTGTALISLTPATTYYLRVCSEKNGTRSTGRTTSFTTAPANPASLGFSNITDTEVDASWSFSSGAKAYKIVIEADTTPIARCTSTKAITIAHPQTYYFATSLLAGTNYFVRVCSVRDKAISTGIVSSFTTTSGGGPAAGMTLIYRKHDALVATSNHTGNFHDAGSKSNVATSTTFLRGSMVATSNGDLHVCAATASNSKYYHYSSATWSSIGNFGAVGSSYDTAIVVDGSGDAYCYFYGGGYLRRNVYDGSFGTTSNLFLAGGLIDRIFAVIRSGVHYVLFSDRAGTPLAKIINSSDGFALEVGINNDGNSGTCSTETAAHGMVLDSSNNIHIVYSCASGPSKYLVHAEFNGTWSYERITGIVNSPLYANIAIDKNDKLHFVVIESGALNMVGYRTNKSGAWSSEIVVVNGGFEVPSYPQIQIDNDLDVHVVMGYDPDSGDKQLRYYRKTDAAGTFTKQTDIDTTADTNEIFPLFGLINH